MIKYLLTLHVLGDILNILGVYVDLKQNRKIDLRSEDHTDYFKHVYFNNQSYVFDVLYLWTGMKQFTHKTLKTFIDFCLIRPCHICSGCVSVNHTILVLSCLMFWVKI